MFNPFLVAAAFRRDASMQHRKALAIGALSLITLAVAPVAPAVADGRHFGGHGFHHFGLGGVVADVVVGIVTLPLAIAAAAVSYEPRQYAPEYSGPQGYESGPGNYAPQGYYQPPSYYGPPAAYYRPAPRYYAPSAEYDGRPTGNYYSRPRYNAPSGRPAASRSGYYDHPH